MQRADERVRGLCGARRHGRRPPAGSGGLEHVVPPLVRWALDAPARVHRSGGMWGDGRGSILAQSVAHVHLAQAGVEFFRDWPQEEVVQLEGELAHEAGGESLDRAGLEVRRVQEFGEE